MLENQRELEEWEVRPGQSIGPGVDRIVLTNEAGRDAPALRESLLGLVGRERIRTLVIAPSSRLTDMEVLQAFPALTELRVHGQHLQSLEGLQHFAKGTFLVIDTEKNKRRDIQRISGTSIRTLDLAWSHPGDLPAVAKTKSLRDVTLRKSPAPEFSEWHDLRLETLALVTCQAEEIRDVAHLGSLRRLHVADCRRLKRFGGDCGGVEWLLIQACGKLDLGTLKAMRSVKSVDLVGTRREPVDLRIFEGLAALRRIGLRGSKVASTDVDLKGRTKALEEILVNDLTKPGLLELSRRNKGVVVWNASQAFKDGEPV